MESPNYGCRCDRRAPCQISRQPRPASSGWLSSRGFREAVHAGAVSTTGRVLNDVSAASEVTPIVQIVPRFAPAICGVGDYARWLATKLERSHGINTRFVVGDPTWNGGAHV